MIISYLMLAVLAGPAGSGNVSASPGSNCAGGMYTYGAVVTLTATPTTGDAFTKWSGDASGTTGPVTVTMKSDKSVTGNFTLLCCTLTTNMNPGGSGGVGVSPGSNCAGGKYTYGTVVMLTATANPGHTFTKWTGSISSSTNPLTLTMNANKTETANFK